MAKFSKQQSGGTLLGLILGVIIGLLIAVGVALMIKGSPVPFAGKIDKAGKDEKAQAAATEKLGDPNQPLYVRRDLLSAVNSELTQRAQESAGESALKALKALGGPLLGQKSETAPGPAPASGTEPAQQQQLAMVQKSDKPANVVDGLIYYLQAGAYRNKAEAEGLRGRLALLGVSAKVMEGQTENGPLHRVWIGPFSQTSEMTRARAKLAENGVDSFVVRQ